MVENKLSSVALYSNFVLAVDVDLVVDMGLQLLGFGLQIIRFITVIKLQALSEQSMPAIL